MKINYEKTQHVLEIATKLLHREEEKSKMGNEEYKKIVRSLNVMMPRFE
jgi:hypothetical protein